MVNQEIKDKIWSYVGPNSVILAGPEMILEFGEEGVSAVIYILKNPLGEYGAANQFVLSLALEWFAEKGNRDAIHALYELAEGKIPVYDDYGQSALDSAKRFVAENQSLIEKNSTSQPDPISITQQGYAKDKEGNLDDAISLYLKALSIDPNYSLARSNLGHAYKNQGKLKEAIKEWEETLRRGAPDSIAIPIPRNIDDVKRILYEQENKNKDKDLEDVDKILSSYIKELEKKEANWRDICPKIVRIGDTAVPILIKALGSRNETLQLRALGLLVDIGGDDAMNALKRAYKKGNENLRFYIKRYITDIDEQIKDELKDSPETKWWQFWKK